jgi:hypothetical protein
LDFLALVPEVLGIGQFSVCTTPSKATHNLNYLLDVVGPVPEAIGIGVAFDHGALL